MLPVPTCRWRSCPDPPPVLAEEVHLTELRPQVHAVARADPQAPVVVYCKSGMRGGMAQGALRKLGYTNVSNIVGGFDAWQKAGLPVTIS